MKKQQREFEQWAHKVVAKYQKVLLLDRHTVNLEADAKAKSFMQCAFREPYLDATILYNPKQVSEAWNKRDFAELRHALVHELCHVVTDPFYDKASQRYVGENDLKTERERLTDHLAMIVEKNNL